MKWPTNTRDLLFISIKQGSNQEEQIHINTPFSEKQASLSAEIYKSVGSENETNHSTN